MRAKSTWLGVIALACVAGCYQSHVREGEAGAGSPDAGVVPRFDAGLDAHLRPDGSSPCDVDGDGVDGIDMGCGGRDCDDADPTRFPGAMELCNGRDDDCNGRIDETFECEPGVEQPCMTACGTAGSRICGTSCGFSPCRPPPEICDNGIDDDCDSMIDEPFVPLGSELTIAGSEFRYPVSSPDIAWTSDSHIVTWVVEGPSDAYGHIVNYSRVSAMLDSASAPSRVVRRHPGFLQESDLVTGASPPLVLYAVATMAGREILASQLRADGSGVIREVPLGETLGAPRTPAGVARGTDGMMVAYRDDPGVFVRPFATDGTPAGERVEIGSSHESTGLSIVDVESGWAVGFLGDDEVARVALISPSADRVIAMAALNAPGEPAGPPALAWTGREIAAVWTDPAGEVVTARADRALAMVGAPVSVGMALDRLIRPAIAWTGGRVVLAWRAPEGVRVMVLPERAGEVPHVLDVTAGTGTEPGLVWTGSFVTLVWADGAAVTDPGRPSNVHLARYVGVCP